MGKIFQFIRKLMGVSESDQPSDLDFLESEEAQPETDSHPLSEGSLD